MEEPRGLAVQPSCIQDSNSRASIKEPRDTGEAIKGKGTPFGAWTPRVRGGRGRQP